MLTAIVEEDGRIRLPDEVREAAHLEPGQEVEVLVDSDGVVSLFAGATEDEPRYSEEFLAGLRRAISQVESGEGTVYETGEAFLAALDREL